MTAYIAAAIDRPKRKYPFFCMLCMQNPVVRHGYTPVVANISKRS